MEHKPIIDYYPNNLCEDYSPTVPFDFPKENLP